MKGLTLALPKGKLLGHTLKALRAIGIDPPGLEEDSRKLVHHDPELGMTFLIARASDVPTFVEHGASDLGVVGKDVLMEGEKRVYELLDLRFGACRFVVAGPKAMAEEGCGLEGLRSSRTHLRVATKFPRVTERHFVGAGRPVEIIALHGSVELAPAVGLAELIVDLVETGRTLKENGLVVVEEVAPSTARLISNGVSMRLKRGPVFDLAARLRAYVEGEVSEVKA